MVRVALAVARQVNDGAGNLPAKQQAMNSNKISLHASMRRWIGTEKQYSHSLPLMRIRGVENIEG